MTDKRTIPPPPEAPLDYRWDFDDPEFIEFNSPIEGSGSKSTEEVESQPSEE